MKLVDDFLGLFSGLVEQADIGRIANVGRRAAGIDNQLATIRGGFACEGVSLT